MTPAIDVPVESGRGYTIAEVDGHEPTSLDNFTGDIHLRLTRNGQVFQVSGAGSPPAEDLVRFYQKEVTLHDRDIRVWTITHTDESGFLAVPCAAF